MTKNKPHPRYTFDTPTFEQWATCPECRSEHIQLYQAPKDTPNPVSTVLWFECQSCHHESKIQAGYPVEQPDGGWSFGKTVAALVLIFLVSLLVFTAPMHL